MPGADAGHEALGPASSSRATTCSAGSKRLNLASTTASGAVRDQLARPGLELRRAPSARSAKVLRWTFGPARTVSFQRTPR